MAAPPGRRQSTRQVSRTSRPQNYYARNFSRDLGNGPPQTNNDTPGFFPAIQHFTDAVDALPKEIIRHFSMLKEVEAKLHEPDEKIAKLGSAIANLPPPRKRVDLPVSYFPSLSAQNSVDGSRHGSVVGASDGVNGNGNGNGDDNSGNEVEDRERQALFYHLNMNIAMMAPALDEKIAVLSTANQTLQRQLDRMLSSYNHIPEEVSDEARLGNPKHWAYVTDKAEAAKKVVERPSRREVANTNTLAAAAAAVEGEFASRSEARREAVAARKGRMAAQIDSDFDDRPPPKKGPGKAKKTIEDKSVGLGIANGTAGPTKRKKPAIGSVGMERSASGAGAMAQAMRGNAGGAGSPRETPEVGGKKRAKPGPVAKKSRAPGAASPYLGGTSSPIIGTFPAKEPPVRPAQNRNRQNSTANSIASALENNRTTTRPASSQSNRPTNSGSGAAPSGLGLSAYEQLQAEAASASTSHENLKPLPDQAKPVNMKSEEQDNGEDVDMADVEQQTPAVPVITRAGRQSKTATPLSSTFPDLNKRGGRGGGGAKDTNASGSHASSESGEASRSRRTTKKSEKAATASAAPSTRADDEEEEEPELEPDVDDMVEGEEEEMEGEGEGEGEEGNEPKYCYCNDVSYGEMVACDNDDCAREWFHLKCAGLTRAPDENTKWYCDDCKELMKGGGRKGRPASSRG